MTSTLVRTVPLLIPDKMKIPQTGDINALIKGKSQILPFWRKMLVSLWLLRKLPLTLHWYGWEKTWLMFYPYKSFLIISMSFRFSVLLHILKKNSIYYLLLYFIKMLRILGTQETNYGRNATVWIFHLVFTAHVTEIKNKNRMGTCMLIMYPVIPDTPVNMIQQAEWYLTCCNPSAFTLQDFTHPSLLPLFSALHLHTFTPPLKEIAPFSPKNSSVIHLVKRMGQSQMSCRTFWWQPCITSWIYKIV